MKDYLILETPQLLDRPLDPGTEPEPSPYLFLAIPILAAAAFITGGIFLRRAAHWSFDMTDLRRLAGRHLIAAAVFVPVAVSLGLMTLDRPRLFAWHGTTLEALGLYAVMSWLVAAFEAGAALARRERL